VISNINLTSDFTEGLVTPKTLEKGEGMNRIGITILFLVLFQMSTTPANALGFRRPKNPTPTPTPTPTPPPCSTAGPWVDHTPDEYVVHMKGVNGAWVIADCGGDDVGRISVDSFGMGEWETFYVRPLGNGNVAIRTSHNRWLSADDNGGSDVHSNRNAIGGWETFRLEGNLTNGGVVGFQAGTGHWLTARLDVEGIPLKANTSAFGPWEQFTLEVVYAPPVPARKGIVRADHRSIVDDDGHFYPLGQTLFWALRGWKFERERLKQNLQFLKAQKWDYVRILGEVDWAGNDINPAWPDYDQNLAEFLDYAYNECGLRTELTIIGGGHEDQAMALTQRIANVVRGREHMIMNFEVANEWYGRRLSKDELRSIGKFLRQQFPNNMVAISSDGFENLEQFRNEFMRSDSANLMTTHMDRGQGDEGWREVRQTWDYKDQNFPVSHNEPIGPRSSVAQDDDPVRLAMLRAVGLINGVTAFVLHNANGVTGQVYPERNRQANLFELANVEAIMSAIRGVDAFFPPRVGEGRHWNHAWSGSPLTVDDIWASNDGHHGVNRHYQVEIPGGWVSTAAGVKDFANFRVTSNSHVEVYDVIQGKVLEVDLNAGESFRLTPVSRDNFGNGGFIIVGHYR
jgi:hypothetical protein